MTTLNSNDHADKTAQSYFRKIHRYYQESVERETIAGVQERIRREIGPRLEGFVLDIGSGGVSDYETDEAKTIVSLDYVFESLKNAKDKNVLSVAGDIRALPFKNDTVDRIIIQQVIHHLTENILEKSMRNVRNALAESARVLKKGGRVFVVDSMAPPWLEFLEKAHYIVSYYVLKALRKPMVFFLSSKKLCDILRGAGLVPDKVLLIDWGEMIEVSRTLFPGLRFPLKFTPVHCILISAVKD